MHNLISVIAILFFVSFQFEGDIPTEIGYLESEYILIVFLFVCLIDPNMSMHLPSPPLMRKVYRS